MAVRAEGLTNFAKITSITRHLVLTSPHTAYTHLFWTNHNCLFIHVHYEKSLIKALYYTVPQSTSSRRLQARSRTCL